MAQYQLQLQNRTNTPSRESTSPNRRNFSMASLLQPELKQESGNGVIQSVPLKCELPAIAKQVMHLLTRDIRNIPFPSLTSFSQEPAATPPLTTSSNEDAGSAQEGSNTRHTDRSASEDRSSSSSDRVLPTATRLSLLGAVSRVLVFSSPTPLFRVIAAIICIVLNTTTSLRCRCFQQRSTVATLSNGSTVAMA